MRPKLAVACARPKFAVDLRLRAVIGIMQRGARRTQVADHRRLYDGCRWSSTRTFSSHSSNTRPDVHHDAPHRELIYSARARMRTLEARRPRVRRGLGPLS